MPKQVIDITTPESEDQELDLNQDQNQNQEQEEKDDFSVVLASAGVKAVSRKKGVKNNKEKTSIKVEYRDPPKSSTATKNRKVKEKMNVSFSFALPKIALKMPVIIVGVLVVLAGVFLYFTMQAKAIVRVKPVLEPIKIDEEIQVSQNQTQVDFDRKVIPGQLLEQEAEKWATFKSTGQETEQYGAAGTIFVYNNINPAIPLTLKEGTRFLSSKDGKIFKAKEKVVLPAATVKNGKITPSITVVAVVAQQQGEEYNIQPAKFSIPGLAGTALYYSVWGESKEKIEGGAQKEVNKITQQDLETAQDNLTKTLKETILTQLNSRVGTGLVLNQEAVAFEEIDFSCSGEAEAKVAEFNCYGKLKARALIFKQDDLQEMAKSFIKSKISANKELYSQSLMTTIVPKGGLTEGGNLAFNLKVEAKLYNTINQEALISKIIGKNQTDLKEVFDKEFPQIERVDLLVKPFWVKKAPKNTEKINLEIVFN